MRFVEPHWIKVVEHDVELGFRLVVVSDLHLGVYKGARFLKRVVEMVNSLGPDVVFLPGDFVYRAKLPGLFNGLKEVKAPMYGVLGNHDILPRGEFEKAEIAEALAGVGVKLVDNEVASFVVDGKEVVLAGVGSEMCGDDRYEHLGGLNGELVIGMAHNPDSLAKGDFSKCDLVICGHTHGGQVRLPIVYKWAIPCSRDFDKGLIKFGKGRALISSGIGETSLPLRLGVRPEIVVLT